MQDFSKRAAAEAQQSFRESQERMRELRAMTEAQRQQVERQRAREKELAKLGEKSRKSAEEAAARARQRAAAEDASTQPPGGLPVAEIDQRLPQLTFATDTVGAHASLDNDNAANRLWFLLGLVAALVLILAVIAFVLLR